MPVLMGRKKKTEPTTTTDDSDAPETPPKPSPMSYRPTEDVYEALQAFRGKYEFPPGYSEIIDRALRMYLRSKGFPKLPEQSLDT